MEPVNIHKAKTHFFSLVERVHEGEEIIIAEEELQEWDEKSKSRPL